MEKFTKPELLNFLCADPTGEESDKIFTASPNGGGEANV